MTGKKEILLGEEMTFFSKKMVSLMARYEDGVLRIPEECVTLLPHEVVIVWVVELARHGLGGE